MNDEFDVVVGGRSLPALQAALDFAEVGLSVAVVAAPGGESLSEAPRDPDGHIARLLHRIATPIEGSGGEPEGGALPQHVLPTPPLLRDPAGNWGPQATPNVLGVPAEMLANQTVKLIGTGAAFRAYLDRVKPLLTVGKTRMFGELVRKRIGAAALQRLVEPQVFERFGFPSQMVEAAMAAPGLNEAMTRAGALSAAVLAYADRNVARETRVSPIGGWERASAELLRRLQHYDVALLESRLSGAYESENDWRVELESGQRLRSRAFVLDQGRGPLPSPGFEQVLDGVRPDFARMHADIDIKRPEWLESGQSALFTTESWAVRIEVSASGDARARLASAAGDLSELGEEEQSRHCFDPGSERLRAELEATLGLADLSPAADAQWCFALAAAPFAVVIERDATQESLEALSAEAPTLLPVGRALHGDDLATALDWSHRGAVALRRRLLGLTASD